MSNVPNNNNKIQVESVRFLGAASESTMQAIGGAINQLFDDRDAETAARIAADNVLQGEINTTNANLLALEARVDNAHQIIRVYSQQIFLNPTGGSADLARIVLASDDGTYVLKTISGGPFPTPYVETIIQNTLIPVTALTWGELRQGATNANLALRVNVFRATPV